MRIHGWMQKLSECIDAHRGTEFRYGAFDCALFAADCVQAMTGVDYAAELRGYDSKIAAYRIVASYGSLEAMITALLGREPKHASQAMRGDVVLAEIELAPGETGECIGICCGSKLAFPQGVGVRFVSMFHQGVPRARLAWSID